MMVVLATLGDPGRSLCWVAPVAADSELATEDPLALDYISQQVGLMLLPALTTRSSRAQAFAMVLYGLALAERAIGEYGEPSTDESRRLLFERWERFWALAAIEFRDGELPRGDDDAMRGVRGALAAWRPGGGALPLDFPLISRQQELGNLGAYLSPLRRSGLIIDGTLRPSAAGLDIIDAFWDEADNKHRGRYDEYAMLALDRRPTKIERTNANLSLRRLGQASRLSSLVARGRTVQQRRLYEAIFERARDPFTLAVTALVEAATKAKVVAPRDLLTEAIAGRFGAIDGPLRELLITALRFGDTMQSLLAAFDRVYTAVHDAGWTASSAKVVNDALDTATMADIRGACQRLLEAPRVSDLQSLPMHGRACIRLAEELAVADGTTALDALLGYHASVQRDRRRGDGWIRSDTGALRLVVTSYTARPDGARFPSFKLDTVRSLLADAGRLQPETAPVADGSEP
jgi:hypothetical protein